MKTHLCSFLLILIPLSSLKAQVDMPYVTGFDNATQQAGWQQYRKGAQTGFEEWEFESSEAFSSPNTLIHYYPVNGQDPTDDWFVSPAFNIAAGGALDSMRYAFNGFGTPQSGDTIFIYLLNGSADPDLATSVTVLHEFSGVNYQSDNTWRPLSPITLAPQSGNSYIAIRYKTIVNWLDVRFDNIGISRISLANINEIENNGVEVYPNPAVNQVNVKFNTSSFPASSVTMSLYNAAGQMVYSAPVFENMPVDLSVAPGLYTYRLQDLSAAPLAQGKLVVQ